MKEKINTKKLSTTLIAFESFFDLHKHTYNGVEYLELKDVLKLFDITIENIYDILKADANRFPSDFVFLIKEKNRKELAFTLAGLLMLAGQINTERGIKINLQLIEYLSGNKPNLMFELLQKRNQQF